MLAVVDTGEDILTLPQAAELIGIAHVTLWRFVKAGRIPHIRIGPLYAIKRADAERFRDTPRRIGRPSKPAPPAE